MTTLQTTFHPVRFSSLVLAEMQALVEDADATAEMDETQQVLVACWEAPIVVRRKNHTHTHEAHLSVEGARLFAKEVAYYRWHAEECLRECPTDSIYVRADIRKTISACQSAINSANKVLEDAGEKPVTSYWD